MGHGGSFVGYRAATLRYPGERVAVMVLCNFARTNPMELALAVGEVLLEERMGPPPQAPDPAEEPEGEAEPLQAGPGLTEAEVDALLGRYYSEEVDATIRVLSGEGGLAVDINGARTLPLRLLGPDRFAAGYLTMTFLREDGRVTGLRAGSQRARGVLFLKQ